MLIKFSIKNFLSFNEREEFSMEAGKARKFSNRIYKERKRKLTKCKVMLGANASGKSNLVEACQFVQDIVIGGIPMGFSNKYFRQEPMNSNVNSEFEIETICGKRRLCYGFSVLLSTGSIQEEWLYERMVSGVKKELFIRNVKEELFVVGDFFKGHNAIKKLLNYGEDISQDDEVLFLTVINKNKSKMFEEFPELEPLRQMFRWFTQKLNISIPSSILMGYPYFTDTNLEEIAEMLNALGTGISDLRIIELPHELVKNKIQEDMYNRIMADLEKERARHIKDGNKTKHTIMVRSYKEFYTFEICENNEIKIRTIEFSHEREGIYFNLNEESDGTARLLDLIEILLSVSDNQIFIIDEIDRCLHPEMTVKIMELFLKMAEVRDTQLIITSHESRLVAAEILRNDEICLVIKNDKGATKINPLEKYQVRADKKIYTALFDGTLDAVPVFKQKKLSEMIGMSTKS